MKRIQRLAPLGIRQQLTLWYSAVFAVLLLVSAALFYARFQATLAGSLDTASGAYRARARNDSISVSTELIHPVSARSSSQPRSAADSASAWTSLTTAAESR